MIRIKDVYHSEFEGASTEIVVYEMNGIEVGFGTDTEDGDVEKYLVFYSGEIVPVLYDISKIDTIIKLLEHIKGEL